MPWIGLIVILGYARRACRLPKLAAYRAETSESFLVTDPGCEDLRVDDQSGKGARG
jgi:hypothetical protein